MPAAKKDTSPGFRKRSEIPDCLFYGPCDSLGTRLSRTFSACARVGQVFAIFGRRLFIAPVVEGALYQIQ